MATKQNTSFLAIVAVIIVIAVLLFLGLNYKGKSSVPYTTTTTPTTQESNPQQSDTSDTGIDADLKEIEKQLDLLDTDAKSIDNGLNDKSIDLNQ